MLVSERNEEKVIQQINLSELASKFSVERLESAVVALFMRKNKIHSRNTLLLKFIGRADQECINALDKTITRRNFTLSFLLLQKIFETLEEPNERKKTGTYYTPLFVVDYIADETIKQDVKILDPSCGCGAFLLGATDRIHKITGKSIHKIIAENIYGVDISENAITRAKIMLILYALTNGEDSKEVKFHLVTGDSLLINWEATFPEVYQEGGFGVVLGNPPYADVPSTSSRKQILEEYVVAKDSNKLPNMYLLFLELMLKVTKSNSSRAGMIVPLSLAYNASPEYRVLRKIIQRSGGQWRLSFFDRTPDSLFGDKIKTRNCIIMHSTSDDQGIFVTQLNRWNSGIRHQLFSTIRYQKLGQADITPGIPKISYPIELSTLNKLHNRRERLLASQGPLFRFQSPTRKSKLCYYSTAYNWIPIFKEAPPSADARGKRITPESLKELDCNSEEQAGLIFAVLSSRLTYWYWLVYGDGFHMNESFLRTLPIDPVNFSATTKNRLITLGNKLWLELKSHPISKVNKGKNIGNYNLLGCGKIVDEIDKVLVSELNLNKEFAEFLRFRHHTHVKAGRSRFKNALYVSPDIEGAYGSSQ